MVTESSLRRYAKQGKMQKMLEATDRQAIEYGEKSLPLLAVVAQGRMAPRAPPRWPAAKGRAKSSRGPRA